MCIEKGLFVYTQRRGYCCTLVYIEKGLLLYVSVHREGVIAVR